MHPQEQPITDDSSYNAGLTRRLFAVYDLTLSIKLQVTGTGELAIRHYDGEQEWEIRLNPAEGRFELQLGRDPFEHRRAIKRILEGTPSR